MGRLRLPDSPTLRKSSMGCAVTPLDFVTIALPIPCKSQYRRTINNATLLLYSCIMEISHDAIYPQEHGQNAKAERRSKFVLESLT